MVDDIRPAASDRLVEFHESERNRSRDTFIFPRTTHQIVVFVVEGREYVVTIFVGFKATPIEVSLPPSSGDRGSEPTCRGTGLLL